MKVSVVIPLYNAAAWIEETLKSVQQQTLPTKDLEVLVIDDGSQDDGPRIAQDFFAQNLLPGRVVPLGQNQGLGAARNTGWGAASADWIQFLDADDLLAPEKLELQLAAASQGPRNVAVVYSDWQSFMLIEGRWRPEGAVNELCVDDAPVVRILQDYNFGYVGPTLIRKSAIEAIGGFSQEPNLGEDIDLMLRLAMSGAGFHHVPSRDPLFFYRDTPHSLWRKSAANSLPVKNLLRTFRRVEEFLRSQSHDDMSEAARVALARRYALRLDVLNELDPSAFREALGWIDDLSLRTVPWDTRSGMRLVSRAVGYTNALRLRSLVRRNARRARSAIRAHGWSGARA